MQRFGEAPKGLEFDNGASEDEPDLTKESKNEPEKVIPPKQDEYLWAWKVSGKSS